MATYKHIGFIIDDSTNSPINFEVHSVDTIGPGYRIWGEVGVEPDVVTIPSVQFQGELNIDGRQRLAERLAADALRKHRAAKK